MSLPPGPKLPPSLQSVLVYTRPVAWIEKCRRRYGDIFTLRERMFGRMVCVADRGAIKTIFKSDSHAFEATSTPLDFVFGPTSVVTTDGEPHRRMRKLLQPSFHGEGVRNYGRLTAEITRREVERWPVEEPFRMAERSVPITLEVILRASFGDRAKHVAELQELTPRLIAPNPALFIELLRHDFGPRSPWGRFLRLLEQYDALIYDDIANRRREVAAGIGAEEPDVLSLLLRASDEQGEGLSDLEIRDQLVSIIIAGSEAAASGVDWAFERLLRHPRVLDRLRSELANGGGGEYLDAVVRETLRARPIVMATPRTVVEETELGGYRMPPGMVLFISVVLVHHSPDLYADPYEFRPERFLERDPEPFEWLSFGGGVHRCIGANLAWAQMKLMIATILQMAELEAPDATPERVKTSGPFLKPAKGATVKLKRRLAVA